MQKSLVSSEVDEVDRPRTPSRSSYKQTKKLLVSLDVPIPTDNSKRRLTLYRSQDVRTVVGAFCSAQSLGPETEKYLVEKVTYLKTKALLKLKK
jgi:hypothetical protein